jgi:hypothetical protein
MMTTPSGSDGINVSRYNDSIMKISSHRIDFSAHTFIVQGQESRDNLPQVHSLN